MRLALAVIWLCATTPAAAIAQDGRAAAGAAAPAEELIALNFPENLEVKLFAEYVSQRLGINILYDEQVGNKRLTLRAPAPVPESSLLPLLESALRMKGLALVEAQPPGWKRIVAANDLLQVARGPLREGEALAEDEAGVAVTQVFALAHVDPRRAEALVKPFLTQPGANMIALPERGMLIVTEWSGNLPRVAELLRLLDRPRDGLSFEFVAVAHMDAAQMATQVVQLLASKAKAEAGMGAQAAEGLDVTSDPRTNRLVLVGTRSRVDEALALARQLDVPLDLVTRVYQFHSASPERVDRLAREILGPLEARRLYRSAVDREANLLVVTAPPDVQQRVDALRHDLDRPVAASQSPVRFHKLQYAKAAEVLATIRALEAGAGLGGIAVEGAAPAPDGATAPAGVSREGISRVAEGLTRPGTEVKPPAAPGEPATIVPTAPPQDGSAAPAESPPPPGAQLGPLRQVVQGRQATVTADAGTNTIIVVADPQTQRVYEALIAHLDKRRPQVMVELMIVTLDTSRGFSLGVEIAGRGTAGETSFLTFSRFGLSTIHPETGRLTLSPGMGFNGVVLAPDVADVVIRALSTSSKARVSSAPKILVNDNATGTLESVNEAPFTTVAVGTPVAVTTFAGFVQAGTSVSVTPHISQGDHLQLEYEVALNTFTGAGSAGVPPPRQTNSVRSEVTIPDGHTIVVGGLSRTDSSLTKAGVPFLSDIPLLEYLFSSRELNESSSTLFVFIKPVILRDDRFGDLKYLSGRETAPAGLPGDLPGSEPILMH